MLVQGIVKNSLGALVAASWLAAIGLPNVWAITRTLKDENAEVRFDPNTSQVFDWEVEEVTGVKVKHLTELWFWYRVGNARENSLATLNYLGWGIWDSDGDGDLDRYSIVYDLTPEGLRFSVDLSLKSGLPSNYESELAVQVNIYLDSLYASAPVQLSFFQYSNFDLYASQHGDRAQIKFNPSTGRPTEVVQQEEWDGFALLRADLLSPEPVHAEIAQFPSLRSKLTDEDADNLNDTYGSVLLDDVEWALQWDFTLDPGESVTISSRLVIIPEPTTGVLVGVALVGVGAVLRRRV